MKRTLLSLMVLLAPGIAPGDEVPASGPERLAWMRRHLAGTISKFEFEQGYPFRKQPEKLRPLLEAVKARGFNVWDQMGFNERTRSYIWDDEQLASLERTLQVAGEVGLSVWATMCPPSESEEIARMPLAERRERYYALAERFARLAKKYPSFAAFTCDDFSHDFGFFNPEMLAEMARRWRAICPRLAFVPLVYYPGVREEFFKTCGPYIDGIVFHFRAESYPPAYLPGYDPKNFDMYGDVMRWELKRVRQIAGDHPVICGIYVWYYQGGWGVLTPDGKPPAVEHSVRDAVQKAEIAHQFADGLRVYGLGIDHEVYRAVGGLLQKRVAAGDAWGQSRGEPDSHLGRWQQATGPGPFLGTLLSSERGLGYGLPRLCPWQRIELTRDFRSGKFEPAECARRYPLLIASKLGMSREWPRLLEAYARAGGTLVLEFVPGWQLDTSTSPLREGEQPGGDRGVLTLELARLSGVEFHYEPRGFATRWRVVKDHPLTKGMEKVGVWHMVSYKDGETTYPLLVHPAKAADADVLIEVEHQQCRYDGVAYVRHDKINGVYPLLTVKRFGAGSVIRHYAAVDPGKVFAEAYATLLTNLQSLAAKSNR